MAKKDDQLELSPAAHNAEVWKKISAMQEEIEALKLTFAPVEPIKEVSLQHANESLLEQRMAQFNSAALQQSALAEMLKPSKK